MFTAQHVSKRAPHSTTDPAGLPHVSPQSKPSPLNRPTTQQTPHPPGHFPTSKDAAWWTIPRKTEAVPDAGHPRQQPPHSGGNSSKLPPSPRCPVRAIGFPIQSVTETFPREGRKVSDKTSRFLGQKSRAFPTEPIFLRLNVAQISPFEHLFPRSLWPRRSCRTWAPGPERWAGKTGPSPVVSALLSVYSARGLNPAWPNFSSDTPEGGKGWGVGLTDGRGRCIWRRWAFPRRGLRETNHLKEHYNQSINQSTNQSTNQ